MQKIKTCNVSLLIYYAIIGYHSARGIIFPLSVVSNQFEDSIDKENKVPTLVLYAQHYITTQLWLHGGHHIL